MSPCVKSLATGLVFVCLAVASVYAQQKTDSSDTSLGDVARKLQAQKTKEAKPAKVFTNDSLTAHTAEPSAEKKPADTAPASGKRSPAHDEKYFRERLSTLQAQLDTHKRELDVLQQKLDQNQMQYYPNPQDSLMQQYTRSDINKKTDNISAKKQQIADDEKAIEDLHDQLRQEDGDPDWLR